MSKFWEDLAKYVVEHLEKQIKQHAEASANADPELAGAMKNAEAQVKMLKGELKSLDAAKSNPDHSFWEKLVAKGKEI